MWNLSRRQVNDSDLLEMLADQRGTETLPLTPSSNQWRADIEESDDATGNYVTNEGVWFRLGRGVKERRTIAMKNKEVKPATNRRNARQSPKNNRRRYPRIYEARTPTMALPHPSMSTSNPPDPAKTSKVLLKRLSPAALRSS